ncbi:hypothetical protein NPIL_451381, partial [Nephila pilipes]
LGGVACSRTKYSPIIEVQNSEELNHKSSLWEGLITRPVLVTTVEEEVASWVGRSGPAAEDVDCFETLACIAGLLLEENHRQTERSRGE